MRWHDRIEMHILIALRALFQSLVCLFCQNFLKIDQQPLYIFCAGSFVFCPGGAAYPSDDETAIAAAIGASLDTHEENLKGGLVGGDSNDSPTPSTVPGSHASQDLAFLTDAPLLPPAAARDGIWRGIWGPMDDGISRTGGGVGGARGASRGPGAGGAMFGEGFVGGR